MPVDIPTEGEIVPNEGDIHVHGESLLTLLFSTSSVEISLELSSVNENAIYTAYAIYLVLVSLPVPNVEFTRRPSCS